MSTGGAPRATLSIVELLERFPNDETARHWFEERRWPDGRTCPRCNSPRTAPSAKATMPYRCQACGKHFSVRIGTVMERSNLGYRTWAIATYLMITHVKGVSANRLHRDLGISYKAAWHLAHRIRKALEDENSYNDPVARRTDYSNNPVTGEPPEPGEKTSPGSNIRPTGRPSYQPTGPVEVDETYIGGRARNRHSGQPDRPKVGVIGMKDRRSGRIVAETLSSDEWRVLRDFVEYNTPYGATVYTDGHPAYLRLWGRKHRAVNHTSGEYVRDGVTTNGIESFWSLLKRGFIGTYHHWSTKHLDRYVNEFSGRHNLRSLDTIERMGAVADGMVGRRLPYRRLVA